MCHARVAGWEFVLSLCPVPPYKAVYHELVLFGNQCIRILLPTYPLHVHYYILLSGEPCFRESMGGLQGRDPLPCPWWPFWADHAFGLSFPPFHFFHSFSEEILFSLTPFFSSSFFFFHLPPPKRGPYTHQTSAFPLSYIPCLNLLFIISRTMIPLFSTDFLIYIFITEK